MNQTKAQGISSGSASVHRTVTQPHSTSPKLTIDSARPPHPTARVTARYYQQAQTHSISGPHPSTISLAIVPPTSLSTLSDHQLLMLCTQYGTQAKAWRQKFSGLLPEVDRRQLYLKEGCSSVFEFAAKVGGVSKEQVQRVLQLEKRFESTPVLQQALTSGEVTVHKLARIASVVTPENQEFLLNQSKLLSNRGLETLVKDSAQSRSVHVHSQKPNKIQKIAQFDELNLAPDVRQMLLDMQNKGIDHNQVLRELLKERSERIQEQKHSVAQELREKEMGQYGDRPSRYIPQKVRAVLKQEYGQKCAQEICTNKATNIHHTRRFGLNSSHNPLFLAPLCKPHHEIAHSIDVKVQEKKRSMTG